MILTSASLDEVNEEDLALLSREEFRSSARAPSLMWAVRDDMGPVMFVGSFPGATMLALPELWVLFCEGSELRLVRVLRRLLPSFRAVHGPALAWVRKHHERWAKVLGLEPVWEVDGWVQVRLK